MPHIDRGIAARKLRQSLQRMRMTQPAEDADSFAPYDRRRIRQSLQRRPGRFRQAQFAQCTQKRCARVCIGIGMNEMRQQAGARSRILQRGEAFGGGFARVRVDIGERGAQRIDGFVRIPCAETLRGRAAHVGIRVMTQGMGKRGQPRFVFEIGGFDHGETAHGRVVMREAVGEGAGKCHEKKPYEKSKRAGASSSKKIRNVDMHGIGRTIALAGHAVPAFVELHERLAGFGVDREQVHRTDVDADRAALVGDALLFVDHHGKARAQTRFAGHEGHFLSPMQRRAATREPHANANTRRARTRRREPHTVPRVS
jgi:hypothetical protein